LARGASAHLGCGTLLTAPTSRSISLKRTNDKLRGWQSDVIVDLIQQYGFEYISLNPGASFRGLHDSLVNYGQNDPPMLVCNHEEIAVQIAHGYAKARFGEPMAVILHNVVGLLHANMPIYYAYIDRVPIFIMGATGPMDEGKRRPHIDWTHTALVQGNAVRDYVKWDYQPSSIDGVPEAFARAYSVMTTEPPGPVYLCFDAGLQEERLTKEVPLPPRSAAVRPSRMIPEPKAIADIADRLLEAEKPLLLPEFVGRRSGGFENMVDLAETVGAPVWDVNSALNFPNKHPLCASLDKGALKGTDLVVGLDIRDWHRPTCEVDPKTHKVTPLVNKDCDWVEMGVGEIDISKWSTDYGSMQPCSVRALGDTSLGIPALTEFCHARIADNPKLRARIEERRSAVGRRHEATWTKWQEEAREDWDAAPMTNARLALEVWDVIKDEDWVLTANTLKTTVRKLWDFDRPYRHPGAELGTSTQIGMSLGVALAHKGSGKLVVDLQPDGDLLYDAAALWVAAKHRIPILIVMYNNRAYYNDWDHQIRMARIRGTDEAKAHIGMDLYDPEPDFGALARSLGMWGEGPIEDPREVRPALLRAIEQVKQGKPALVDTITRHR
jgi:acetolactate synthase I/II/III large subunit